MTGAVRAGIPTSKMVPPSHPAAHVSRARLERELDEVVSRRLTAVMAGAGFGKTVLLATWAETVRAAWYRIDRDDVVLTRFMHGLVAALRPRVATLDGELGALVGAAEGPHGDDLARAESFGGLLAEHLDAQAIGELVVVLDDVHELAPGSASARLVEVLCRHGPPSLRIVLGSRSEPPFAVDRLRASAQLLELDAAALAFTAEETAALLEQLTGPRAHRLAAAVHELTAGWPAAVRLAGEALRPAHRDDAQALDRLRRPGRPLLSYLVEEVLGHESPEGRELVRRMAVLERFTVELCGHLGVPHAEETLARLARRGVFLDTEQADGWLRLHALVRDAVRATHPVEVTERTAILVATAAWCVDHGHLDEALRLLLDADDRAGIADLLANRGRELLATGAVATVAAAGARVPLSAATASAHLVIGEARQVLGRWDEALASFRCAAGDADTLAPALAWRMGLIAHLRGDLDEALATYARARLDDADPADAAMLLAWDASARWLRGDIDRCRDHADRALATARRCGDPEALAAAYTIAAMIAAWDGDRRANYTLYLQAYEAAEQAGNVLQRIRIHVNRGSRSTEEGDYDAAINELDVAIRLAELTGFAAFHGLALSNRGEANLRLGRLDEAAADYEAAKLVQQGLGSGLVAYALAGIGHVRRERGDLTLARAAYEEAIDVAEAAGDRQGLTPALAGLARIVVGEDPEQATALAARAVGEAHEVSDVGAHLSAGWVALGRGRRSDAIEAAVEAAASARRRRDRAGLAESLELTAVAAEQPARHVALLEEAAAIWTELGNPVGCARTELALARLSDADTAHARAAAASQQLRELGVTARASEAAGLLWAVVAGGPDVAIHCLGGFRVLRAGVPVPLAAWQSKKARDLVKILVSRRGRPASREALMDALWPGEDPGRLGNRLSGALSTARAVLDPDRHHVPDHFLYADGGAIGLRTHTAAIDVEAFLDTAAAALAARRAGHREQARPLLLSAEGLYTGDFLEEDLYEPWAAPLREEARATYSSLARALAEDATAVGDWDTAVRHWLRVLDRDPYDEPGHLALVRVLASAGRHGEAHRRYRLYVAGMREIGVEAVPFPTASG